ncbi:MAG: ABC transporter permease [Alphaproteobacteria bacterium]|nr:ABC-2 transporter permease [Alphaproteobacteria bacterium]MDE2109737.1 ABC transporter permease [Alphaproteobacteria bacterium]MDE2494361.1 ABC transporter permease [Alphaproteobacteria bacterium]
MNGGFSLARVFAMLGKEFIQMRRDRLTLGMLIGIPLMQLFLFGFAINMVPRHLATVVSISDPGPFSDSIVAALANSSYFDVVKATNSPQEARRMLADGSASFAVEIPANFSRDLVRGATPELLVEADATDPAAGSYALAAIPNLVSTGLRNDLKGPLASRAFAAPPVNVVVHQLYNPENITQYNIVPGLLGVILTMTMVMATSIALTRERERGTYENLLAMPTRPVEIMIGKITPNIFVGAFQSALILTVAKFVFHVPMIGSFGLLATTAMIYITALLAVGYTISTVAQNQMQAMQMTFFFFLPSIMLSGFIFPFHGMPQWAQWIGEVMPITHFLRIVRGILLKGDGFGEIWPDVWPMILFLFVAGTIAVRRFRRTLD